jgi:tetratricopeptide (TPR) repeat protein
VNWSHAAAARAVSPHHLHRSTSVSTSTRIMTRLLAACLCLACLALQASADELRNLRRGEPMPPYRLVSSEGQLIDSEEYKGTVLVMVYLAAEQRSSELAAIDARAVVGQFSEAADPEAPPVKLLYITADVVRKAYFQRFCEERGLDAPLALDADRSLYGKLGLIVFPTTLIINRDGKLAHVISLHNPDYTHVLDSNIRHALELIDDEQLRERLKARPTAETSPKRIAAAHRALARQMREQGRLEQAREELIKSREHDPENPEILLDLADLEVALNNIDQAARMVDVVLRENPGHRRAKQIRGIVLFHKGQLAEAESVLLEALHLNPDPARIQYYLGRIYEQQGQTAKAVEHYRRALERFLHENGPATPPP